MSPQGLQKLLADFESHPTITYMAVNARGDTKSNTEEGNVNAVTWGVFPGKLYTCLWIWLLLVDLMYFHDYHMLSTKNSVALSG